MDISSYDSFMDTTPAPGANDQTGASAQLGIRSLSVSFQSANLNPEPSYNPAGILTQPQLTRLADRLLCIQRDDVAYMVWGSIVEADRMNLNNFSTRLEGINNATQVSPRQKNIETFELLRETSNNQLTQESVAEALDKNGLGNLRTQVFEPEEDTGSTVVAEQQQLIDGKSRLACLQQVEQQALTTANNTDLQIHPNDIPLLARFLAPMGNSAKYLSYSMLARHHFLEHRSMRQDISCVTAEDKIRKSLYLLLVDGSGVLHDPSDRGTPFTVQGLARLIEKEGYEVLADQLLVKYNLPVQPKPAVEFMERRVLSKTELANAIHTVYQHIPGDYEKKWQTLADAFRVPWSLAYTCYKHLNCSSYESAHKFAVIMDQSIEGGLVWDSFTGYLKKSGLPIPPRPACPKSYPLYTNRPIEEQLQQALQIVAYDWKILGFRLGIKSIVLDEIQQQYLCQGDTLALNQLVTIYMRRRTACWDEILDVLQQIPHMALASELRGTLTGFQC